MHGECICLCHEVDGSGYGDMEHHGRPCPCGTTRKNKKRERLRKDTDSPVSLSVFVNDREWKSGIMIFWEGMTERTKRKMINELLDATRKLLLEELNG